MLGVGHALRRSCAAWRAAAPSLPGRNREPLASAWQLLGERAFAVDAEHARRRAQESAQKLRGADAGADAPSGSGAVDVFDRQVKTQQARCGHSWRQQHARAGRAELRGASRQQPCDDAHAASRRHVCARRSASEPRGWRTERTRFTKR